jgi:RNA methyltransferase, TrmH family
MLAEAVAAGVAIDELYATERAYDSFPLLHELQQGGTPTFVLTPSASASISDVATPTGILAVAVIRLKPVAALLGGRPVLVLADLNDPANAGTLLRSAEAFGAGGVVFGSRGIDPHHPKVVRASMGAVLRLGLGVAAPSELAAAARQAGATVVGLASTGESIASERWEGSYALIVGNERHGLGEWEVLCKRILSIPILGQIESLSAGVAGSIALYQATLSDVPQ